MTTFDYITTNKSSTNTVTKYEFINGSYFQYLSECITLLDSLEVISDTIVTSDTGEVIIEDFSPSNYLTIDEDFVDAIEEMITSFRKSLGLTTYETPTGYTKDFLIALDSNGGERVVPCLRKTSTGQKYLFGEFLFCEVIEEDDNEPARKPSKSRNNKTHTKKLLRQWLPSWRSLAVFDRQTIIE